jgi:hypothetical protein
MAFLKKEHSQFRSDWESKRYENSATVQIKTQRLISQLFRGEILRPPGGSVSPILLRDIQLTHVQRSEVQL